MLARGATGEEKENEGSSPHSLELPFTPSYLASSPFYTQLPLSSIVPLYFKKASTVTIYEEMLHIF